MMKALTLLIALCCSTVLFAQKSTELKQHPLYIGNSVQTVQETFSADNFSKPDKVQYKIGQARIKLELTYGSELDYLSLLGSKEIKVYATVRFKDQAGVVLEEVVNKELVATYTEPELLYIYNFHKFFDKLQTVEVEAQLAQETIGAGISNALLQDLRINIGYEIDYLSDVRLTDADAPLGITQDLATDFTPGQRQVKFKWVPEFEAPFYEFQLLRLDEVEQLDPTGQIAGDVSFYTDLNWDNALTVEIHDYKRKEESSDYNYIELTLAEQGYYTWRVRPVGNYYGKGREYAFGDARNYGNWSEHLETGNHLVNPSMQLPYLFYFEDPDNDKNYAYQRILTEEGRLHESLSYADGLLRAKQSQTYLSSNQGEKKIIFTQDIYDFSGRPSLKLMPVPVEGDGRLNDYMKDQVLNQDGTNYTADDFDAAGNLANQNGNYMQPEKVTGQTYDYYNNPQADERVASTGGYPFSRTIMLNDGTDRPLIQGGIGEDYVIGNNKNTEATYFYSQPSDYELLRIFGEEALPKEAVLKVITRDPDGTTSVSYVTNEGTTIATALVFKNLQEFEDYQRVNNLSVNPEKLPGTKLAEEISKNDVSQTGKRVKLVTGTENGAPFEEEFVLVSTSSKEISFTEPVENIRISYKLSSKTAIAIGCDEFNYDNCDPTVRIYLKNANGRKIAVISPATAGTRIASGTEYALTINPSSPVSGDNLSIVWEKIDGVTQTLTPGETYYIEKELYVRDQDELRGTVTDRAEVLTKIADVIGSWLSEATTEAAMIRFYASTQNFSQLLQGTIKANCSENGTPVQNAPDFKIYGDERLYQGNIIHYCTSLGFPASTEFVELFPSASLVYNNEACADENYAPYLLLTAQEYCVLKDIGFFEESGITPITLTTPAGSYVSAEQLSEDPAVADNFKPDVFKISTHCCGEIEVPVNGVTTPMCPEKFSENDEERAEQMLEISGRFVDFLQTNLIENEELNPEGITLKALTPGYSPLTLKSMFFHMMYDKYVLIQGQEPREQYTCKVLWTALQSTALTYKDLREKYNELNEENADLRNPKDAEEGDGNSKEEQNKAIDENFNSSILAWFIKTFVLKGNDMSDQVPASIPLKLEYDFVDQFLQTVGYKYHKIVTSPTNGTMLAKLSQNYPAPQDYDLSQMPAFLKNWENTKILVSNYFAAFNESGDPVEPSSPENYGYANNNGYQNVLYSNSPVYRFKYAEYGPVVMPGSTYNFTTSEIRAKRDLQMEMSFCFLDYKKILSDNYGGEFCAPVCEGKTDYTQWNSAQIQSYIKALIASRDIVQSPPLSVDETVTVTIQDKQDLLDRTINLMDSCSSRCESRREYIRLMVQREFTRNCYSIVTCAQASSDREVTDTEIEEIVNAIIADCREGCNNLVRNSNNSPRTGCSTFFGEVTVNDDRVDVNGSYPCLKAMSNCYTMEPVISQSTSEMTDVQFTSRALAFRPYSLSEAQQAVYERLMAWEMEFSLDESQNKCTGAETEVPCWLTNPPSCNQVTQGTYSAPVEVNMNQE